MAAPDVFEHRLGQIRVGLLQQGVRVEKWLVCSADSRNDASSDAFISGWTEIAHERELAVKSGDAQPKPGVSANLPAGEDRTSALIEAVSGTAAVAVLPASICSSRLLSRLLQGGVAAFAVAGGAQPMSPEQQRAFNIAAFDIGYVPLSVELGAAVFLRSDLVKSIGQVGVAISGELSMSSLGSNGRFANQLFQYAYVKLYTVRNSLLLRVPHWDGADLYDLADAPLGSPRLPEIRFYAFDDDDLALWTTENRVSDVDLWGYFQERPECLQPHRDLYRGMFLLQGETNAAIETALGQLTEQGTRPLVAIHVRRGDYLHLHEAGLPWYRPVPEEWYADWLDRVLPTLDNPVLFVASDDVDGIAAKFARFSPVYGSQLNVAGVPAHLVDFELLRRSSHLAICNSSFSRMAAVLGRDEQKCAIPAFELAAFVDYLPWQGGAFWSRFENDQKAEATQGYGAAAAGERALMIRRELGQTQHTLAYHEQGRLALGSEVLRLGRKLASTELLLEQSSQCVGELSSSPLGKHSARRLFVAIAVRPIAVVLRIMSNRLTTRLPGLALHLQRMATQLYLGRADVLMIGLRRAASYLRHYSGRLRQSVPGWRAGKLLMHSSSQETLLHAFAYEPLQGSNISLIVHAGSILEHGYGSHSVVIDEVLRFPDRDGIAVVRAAAGDIVCLVNDGVDPEAVFLEVAALVLAALGARASVVCLGPAAPGEGSRQIQAIVVARGALCTAIDELQGKAGDWTNFGDVMSALRSQLAGDTLEIMVAGLIKAASEADGASAHHVWSMAPAVWAVKPRLASTSAAGIARFMAEVKRRVLEKPCIVVIVPWLPIGGSEVLLLDILTRLSASWSIVIATTLPEKHEMTGAFGKLTSEIYHLGNIFDDFLVQATVGGLLESRRPRIVLSSNSATFHKFVPEFKIAHPAISFVDLLHNDLPGGHIEASVDTSSSLAMHIAVSRRVGSSLIARGVPPARIKVIENGIDVTLFRPLENRKERRRSLGFSESAVHLVFVGRLSSEKRPEAFLDVVKGVAASFDVVATIVGHGPNEQHVRDRIASEKLNVTIHPKMSRSDLNHLYNDADILVLTSTVEGMPLVALEALASGCPVAATDVGDLGRIIEQDRNGFLVPVQVPENLAVSICGYMDAHDGTLDSLRPFSGRTVHDAGMDQATMLEKYEKLFASLAGSPTDVAGDI